MELTKEQLEYIEELYEGGMTNISGFCSCLIQFKGCEIPPGKLRTYIIKELDRIKKRKVL